jgi:hypothetical protein
MKGVTTRYSASDGILRLAYHYDLTQAIRHTPVTVTTREDQTSHIACYQRPATVAPLVAADPNMLSLDVSQDISPLFAHWLLAVAELGDTRLVTRQSLITPTYGLGLLSASGAWKSFTLAQQTGALVRSVARS